MPFLSLGLIDFKILIGKQHMFFQLIELLQPYLTSNMQVKIQFLDYPKGFMMQLNG